MKINLSKYIDIFCNFSARVVAGRHRYIADVDHGMKLMKND